jgi:hypothetical protein
MVPVPPSAWHCLSLWKLIFGVGDADDGLDDVDPSRMKTNVEIPQIEGEPLTQDDVDVTDSPPKGLVQELTSAIIAQLKAEGILSGGSNAAAAAPVSGINLDGLHPTMMAMGGMVDPRIIAQVSPPLSSLHLIVLSHFYGRL